MKNRILRKSIPRNPLAHLTLTTGHVRAVPRSEMSASITKMLMPIVEAGGGPIPEIDWFADIFRLSIGSDPIRGAVAFQIALGQKPLSKTPMVFCVACWKEEVANAAWAIALERHEMFGVPLANGIVQPKAPWLTVSLSCMLPVLADLEQILLLGGCEQALAWTLIAQEAALHSRRGR